MTSETSCAGGANSAVSTILPSVAPVARRTRTGISLRSTIGTTNPSTLINNASRQGIGRNAHLALNTGHSSEDLRVSSTLQHDRWRE